VDLTEVEKERVEKVLDRGVSTSMDVVRETFGNDFRTAEEATEYVVAVQQSGVDLSSLQESILKNFVYKFPFGGQYGATKLKEFSLSPPVLDGKLALSLDPETIVWDFVSDRIVLKQDGFIFSYSPTMFSQNFCSRVVNKPDLDLFAVNLHAGAVNEVGIHWRGRTTGIDYRWNSFLPGLVEFRDLPLFFHFAERWGVVEFTKQEKRAIRISIWQDKEVMISEFWRGCEKIGIDGTFVKSEYPKEVVEGFYEN